VARGDERSGVETWSNEETRWDKRRREKTREDEWRREETRGDKKREGSDSITVREHCLLYFCESSPWLCHGYKLRF
jgi:hypothetical protein